MRFALELATVLATAVLPIHPLVWIGKRGWKLATEAACDAEALAATAAEPAEYGRVLVAGAAFPSAPGVMAVAVAAESRWLLKRRLLAMQPLVMGSGPSHNGLADSCRRSFRRRRSVASGCQGRRETSGRQQGPGRARRPHQAPAAELRDNYFNTPPQLIGFITVPQAHIRSLSSGTIQQVSCEEGQQVKKGDLLRSWTRRIDKNPLIWQSGS